MYSFTLKLGFVYRSVTCFGGCSPEMFVFVKLDKTLYLKVKYLVSTISVASFKMYCFGGFFQDRWLSSNLFIFTLVCYFESWFLSNHIQINFFPKAAFQDFWRPCLGQVPFLKILISVILFLTGLVL